MRQRKRSLRRSGIWLHFTIASPQTIRSRTHETVVIQSGHDRQPLDGASERIHFPKSPAKRAGPGEKSPSKGVVS